MRIAFFSTRATDKEFFSARNDDYGHELHFFEARLAAETAKLANGYECVCVFVHDEVGAEVIDELADGGVKLIALRCAGFNNVDLNAAQSRGLGVVRVPAYSPNAVAEHTVALMLALNRHLHRAFMRVREGNLSLDGLLGFDMYGKTVGIIGTGQIGTVVARILSGFGCRLLAFDKYPNDTCKKLGVTYTSVDELLSASDIVTLHCPLTPETDQLIDAKALGKMKDGVMLVNTSRGRIVDTKAVIDALKSGKVGYLGLDVYEEEGNLFFTDLSEKVIQDDVFARLLTFPNVVVTGHQGFFTRTAMENIADTTLGNITAYEKGQESGNEVKPEDVYG